MLQKTLLYFIGHASVLIRYADTTLITDPWFYGAAFSSWSPSPPPVLNPSLLIGLARAHKLGFLISHAHPDHLDHTFLGQIPRDTPLFVPRFEDGHLIRILSDIGLTNCTEIGPDVEISYMHARLRSFPSRERSSDASLSIETPDAFIFHGNDAWSLDDINLGKLASCKPPGKASVFMGQGASASGHPLTYFGYPQEGRVDRLKAKNAVMLRGVARTADAANFDRALAYACFTRIDVDGQNYSYKAPTPHGRGPNEVANTDKFIDLSPGDVYIPADDVVLPILSSLHVDLNAYPRQPTNPSFPKVTADGWRKTYDSVMRDFMAGLESFLKERVGKGQATLHDLDVVFSVDVIDEETGNALTFATRSMGSSGRRKMCRVKMPTMAAVLDRTIPFEDLYTGYLAEWSRDPIDFYNNLFLQALMDYGYHFQSRTDG